MTEEKFLVDIPVFRPEYDRNTEYGYKNKPGSNLEQLLRKTSRNHCMYCYALLRVDRINTGHLEHSIEKKLDEKNLTECVPNIALACPHCNLSLKRVGEKKRRNEMLEAQKRFSQNVKCVGKKCRNECEAYQNLKKTYCKISKIILQPFGVVGERSGLEYRIQYDVLNMEFIPSERYPYSEEDTEYIICHMNQFRLNDAGFKTRALMDFVEDVIEADGKYRKKSEYSNYIVDLFKEKLNDMDQQEVLALCEQIYIRNIALFRG